MRRRCTRLKGILRAGFSVTLAAALGCEVAAPDSAPSHPETSVPALSLPPRGADRGDTPLRYEAGLVWIEIRSADPRQVLWELSERVGFLLDVSGLDPTPVALSFEGAELHAVVAAIARELPFAIEYELDADTARHGVVSVRVGAAQRVARAPAPPRLPPPSRRVVQPERELPSPEHQRLIRALEIANVEARRELVEDLDAVGIELEVLSHVLRNDPDPELRTMAAETLATSGSYGAVKSLVAMLDHEDPSVLLEVIEALEFAGDETVLEDLEPLFDHPDRAVRDASQEAAEFLR